ncbi:hypothetical protein H5T52_06100 [Candidatus Bipolaricaulota bacterium]|nr:hypothetical protein [Candidatus Bipolaricaulota bacterium]
MSSRMKLVPLVVLFLAGLGLAGGIELVPSTFTPTPGEELTLRVMGAPSGAEFYWDFGGDGTVDFTGNAPELTYTTRAGYQEVVLQVVVGGAPVGSARLAITSHEQLGAYRLVQGTDPVEVTLVIRAKGHLFAPGLEESVPPGWILELVDEGGAFTKREDGRLQAVWPYELWTGNEVRLRYLLYPPASGAVARLQGTASAYAAGGGRIEIRIGGRVVIP